MAKDDKKPTTSSGINPDLERVKARGEKLRSDRGTLNSHLEEIAEVILPNAMGFTGNRTSGDKRMSRVYDETGISANELFAANLGGLVTNPSSKWFALRVPDDTINEMPPVKKWRSDVENIMYQEMYAPGTGLTPALDEFYLQLGAFGTGIIFIGETTKGTLQFQARSLAECYHSENSDGEIDEVWRFYSWSVRQICGMSEWSPSPKVLKLKTEGKLDEMIELCHYVGPRANAEYGKKGTKNMPFKSCYFEMATCHELEESGFPEFPYVVARWRKAAGAVWTFSRHDCAAGRQDAPEHRMRRNQVAPAHGPPRPLPAG